ncbi:MAG: DNA lyase [Anaerolineales bacterium]|nr:MAG: DNA lyase [Anaerolineales bacterium]
MRIWSLHPQHLDAKGLTALWRETLLAQRVLQGRTRGYTQHPQLLRFKACADPQAAIATYLAAVHAEAQARGYNFNAALIAAPRTDERLAVSEGQLAYEWQHLLAKLQQRAPDVHAQQAALAAPQPHPMFYVQPGPIAEWERP